MARSPLGHSRCLRKYSSRNVSAVTWRIGLPTPTTTAIDVRCPASRPRCAGISSRSARVARGTRTPGSEEERDGSVEPGLEALERAGAERVVDPQDEARYRPPEETEDSPDLRAARAGLEVLEAHDPVQVVRGGDQRLEPDDVLDVEAVDASLSRARKAPGQLAG